MAAGVQREYEWVAAPILSKGTELSVHSPERLHAVAAELNDRPRKTLGGITPAQAMQRLLLDPESPVVATTA